MRVLLAVLLASAAPSSVQLSTHLAGARDVAVTLRFETAYVCGVPRGPVVVTFPAAERVPATMQAASVLVDGKAAGRVSVSGRAASVEAAAPGGVTCHSIRLGTETVAFSPSAHLGNPSRAGRYTVSLRHGSTTSALAFVVVGKA